MKPEHRIKQAMKVIETGGMCQFDKDSQFAQALRDLMAEIEELRDIIVGLWHDDPDSKAGSPLHEALNMTLEEYQDWVSQKEPANAED